MAFQAQNQPYRSLHTAFKQLVQDKHSSPDFTTLMSEIGKMSGYVSAVGSTSSATTSKK